MSCLLLSINIVIIINYKTKSKSNNIIIIVAKIACEWIQLSNEIPFWQLEPKQKSMNVSTLKK